MSPQRYQRAAGWVAVAGSTGISCLWAWWGIIEAFHEGWYHASIRENLALTLVQYSRIIYWWTATELDERRAYIVVYDGKVWPRPKSAQFGYLGFRAVRSPDGLPSTQTKPRLAESAVPGHASGRGLEPAP